MARTQDSPQRTAWKRGKRESYNSCFCSNSQAISDTRRCKIVTCKVSSGSFDNNYWSHWRSIHQNLGQLLQCLGKLNGPKRRIELIMDMIFLPIIFSVRAAISFLLLLQAILSRENILQFTAVTTQVIHQAFHWTRFLLWLFVTSYSGRFWLSISCRIFIVPIILLHSSGTSTTLAPSIASDRWSRFHATLSQELNSRDGSTNLKILNHWSSAISITILSHGALQETSIWQQSKQHKVQQPLFMTVHWATLMHKLQSFMAIKHMLLFMTL